MIADKQFVFIIGAPRSGTTWLQAMLGAHPSVCTFGEMQLYNFYTLPWALAWNAQIKFGDFNGLPTVWSEEELYQFLREFVDRVYGRVLDSKPTATIILDKHPGYSDGTEHINRLIPGAKFIHIIRDGRDVAASMLAAYRGWGKVWAAKDIETAASVWKGMVMGARDAGRYGDRYLEVRYEELLASGVTVLKRVFDFIGVQSELENIASIYSQHQFEKMKRKSTGTNGLLLPPGFFRKGRVGDWQEALTPTERYKFHEAAGDLLCALGYAQHSWWSEHGYQRFTMPLLTFLSSGQSCRRKTIGLIKRILGPAWTDRISAARARLRQWETDESKSSSVS